MWYNWPISIHYLVYFHHVLLEPYSDVLYSEECQTKNLCVCCKMFALLKPFSNFAKKLFKCGIVKGMAGLS